MPQVRLYIAAKEATFSRDDDEDLLMKDKYFKIDGGFIC